MRAPQPPRLATWLLKRFASGDTGESLIGDLLERYQHGHSWMWYWRQVVVAIVVNAARDIREHKLLAARALVIGWVIYLLASLPVTWLARIIRFQIEDWLVATGHYSFWSVFWSGQLSGTLLVYVVCAASGWIVARFHHAQSAAMVGLYSASMLLVEYGFVSWMFFRYGHPPIPSVALTLPAVLLIGRPLSILIGGLWCVSADDPPRYGL